MIDPLSSLKLKNLLSIEKIFVGTKKYWKVNVSVIIGMFLFVRQPDRKMSEKIVNPSEHLFAKMSFQSDVGY